MTGRERFLQIARGELRGELFLPHNLNYSWFMDETLERWEREGLPEGADVAAFFGLDRIEFVGGKPYSPVPAFEELVLKEEGETRVVRDALGVTKRVHTRHGESTMPQWLDFPIRSRRDFLSYKERLDASSPGRYPGSWESRKAAWEHRGHPLGIASGSFFGHTLQRWVGTENLCVLFYDDPAFVHEMLDFLEGFFLELIRGPVQEVDFDFASFGEDIAYKGRPFLSPAMFREFIQPHYVSVCELLKSNGVELIFVDSDGCVDELIPLWLEVGISGFSPLEVAAGSDAAALRETYGERVVLAGNVDKRALVQGGDRVDREAEKARDLVSRGMYFPAVDHSVPPDVSLESFSRLLDLLRCG